MARQDREQKEEERLGLYQAKLDLQHQSAALSPPVVDLTLSAKPVEQTLEREVIDLTLLD